MLLEVITRRSSSIERACVLETLEALGRAPALDEPSEVLGKLLRDSVTLNSNESSSRKIEKQRVVSKYDEGYK